MKFCSRLDEEKNTVIFFGLKKYVLLLDVHVPGIVIFKVLYIVLFKAEPSRNKYVRMNTLLSLNNV